MPKAWATQAEIQRALKAVEDFGLPIREVEISQGTVRIVTAQSDANTTERDDRAPKQW